MQATLLNCTVFGVRIEPAQVHLLVSCLEMVRERSPASRCLCQPAGLMISCRLDLYSLVQVHHAFGWCQGCMARNLLCLKLLHQADTTLAVHQFRKAAGRGVLHRCSP